MKRVTCLIVICFAAFSAIVEARVTLPQAKEVKLKNGLTVQIIERRSLPLFSLEMTLRAGSTNDPAGMEGLAQFTNEMLMRGTGQRTATQIAEAVASIGGTLRSTCGPEKAGITGEFLAHNGEQGLAILADLLLDSRFSEEEIEKMRTQTLADLQSRLDDPAEIANEKILAAILGQNPYAHLPLGTIGAVKKIGRKDVLGFYKNYYTPDACLLVICGDIDPTTAGAWAEKYFGKWWGKSSAAPPTAAFPAAAGTRIILYDKQDATQTQIRIGNIGLTMTDPAFVPFEAARTLYGGSFTSRLVNEVRVNRGLTYNISCRSNRFAPGGVVYVSTFTKNATVGEVIEIILAEAKRMQTEPVPDSELTGVINYRSGLYPLQFETNDAIAGTFTNFWFYQMTKDQVEGFQEQLRQTKALQLKEMAQKFFPSDNYQLVLVGKAEEVKSQLEKYGTVTVLPLTE